MKARPAGIRSGNTRCCLCLSSERDAGVCDRHSASITSVVYKKVSSSKAGGILSPTFIDCCCEFCLLIALFNFMDKIMQDQIFGLEPVGLPRDCCTAGLGRYRYSRIYAFPTMVSVKAGQCSQNAEGGFLNRQCANSGKLLFAIELGKRVAPKEQSAKGE